MCVKFCLFILLEPRLEQSLIEKEATWLTERQESETTNKLLIEAHGRNEELLNKIEVAENDISKFRDNIQRSIDWSQFTFSYAWLHFMTDLCHRTPLIQILT
jgi:hypothetical protein